MVSIISGMPWSERTVSLYPVERKIVYFEGDKVRGEIFIANGVVRHIDSSHADGRENAFEVSSSTGDSIIFNSASPDLTMKWIDSVNMVISNHWDIKAPKSYEAQDSNVESQNAVLACDIESVKRLQNKLIEIGSKLSTMTGTSTTSQGPSANNTELFASIDSNLRKLALQQQPLQVSPQSTNNFNESGNNLESKFMLELLSSPEVLPLVIRKIQNRLSALEASVGK